MQSVIDTKYANGRQCRLMNRGPTKFPTTLASWNLFSHRLINKVITAHAP